MTLSVRFFFNKCYEKYCQISKTLSVRRRNGSNEINLEPFGNHHKIRPDIIHILPVQYDQFKVNEFNYASYLEKLNYDLGLF